MVYHLNHVSLPYVYTVVESSALTWTTNLTVIQEDKSSNNVTLVFESPPMEYNFTRYRILFLGEEDYPVVTYLTVSKHCPAGRYY